MTYCWWSYKTKVIIHPLSTSIQDWVIVQASDFGWIMKTFTKTKLQNKACQCNAQFPCQNWGLWLNAHCFQGIRSASIWAKSQRIEWFLSVSKSLAYAMGGKITTPSIQHARGREGGEKKKASDKTFTTPESRCEQNVLLNTPSFSLSSSPNREDGRKHGMAMYRRDQTRRGGGIKTKQNKKSQLAAS